MMGRALYESLFSDDAPEDSSPFLSALGRQARLRRTARALADEEFMEGVWVESEEEAYDLYDMRLAAKDSADVAVFEDEVWEISVARTGDGIWTFTQVRGAAGGTVQLDEGTPQWVPLELGEAVVVSGLSQAPESLLLIDARGRQTRLSRRED